MSAIRRLILCAVPLVFLSFSGCATLIEAAIPERETHSLSGAPQVLSVPRASIQPSTAYESPIPRWNSAYQGATSPQTPAEKKSLARAYHTLDAADAIREAMSGLLRPPNSSDQLTPLAVSVCRSGGVPHRREKDWFGNLFSLQPGGLASSIFDGRLKDRCELSYRRSH